MSIGLILGALFISTKNSFAYQQTESTCYSQCAAYKFIWQGTYCWDDFAQNCGVDKGNSILKTIKFLKDIYDTVVDFDGVDKVFTAWYKCKPLIENCIVPRLQDCRQTCQTDKYTYASDLSVGHPESSFHGVYFDEKTKQLYFKLVNNGMGYAWDINVEATFGHTPNRDAVISNNQRLFKETVEHLIYLGARNGPPKSFSDSVGDFLIEESLNGQYLHDFKSWVVSGLDLHSDSKDYNVPNFWIKAVSFTPKVGELNRITFKVDPSQVIPEVWEQNNTFVLDIDLRPTPAQYSIEAFTQKIVESTLNSFLVNFQVKNTGEESGLAKVKIYNGKYKEGKIPVYQSEENISGKSNQNFETTINIDLSSEFKPYCGKYKEYTIVVIDEEGNKTERSFSLPIYLGSVNGQVEDLFGKRVIGATIRTTTGEETQSNKYGYRLTGITALGKITITATHPEYSKSETKEIEFKYGNEFDACKEGNLLFNSVNFVLKDQDVLFTVTIKDSSGNPVTAQVLANNAASWRFDEIINGTGPLPGMQPGKYLFTISAVGYKTISQDVNAVPNDQSLEFTLEKLQGRPNDDGLHLITPRLLWEKTLGQGERIISNMSGSKNGKLLVAYALDNKAKNSNLYFLDLTTGRLIKETPASYALGYEGDVGLDTSYDGGTVGFNAEIKTSKGWDHIMRVFDSSGNEFGSIPLEYFTKGKGGVATQMNVSPDGFYLCPGGLFNKGMYKYTRYEIEGGDYDYGRPHAAGCGEHFLRNNNIITPCKGKQEGYCEETLAKQQVRVIGDIDEGGSSASTFFDSTFNDQIVVVRTYKKIYYLGGSNWKKEVESDNMYKSMAVSPGGMYTIVTEGGGANLRLKIFGNTGNDKTPDFPYKKVRFVFANDKGLFFAQVVLNKIEFYQVGEYETEYKPQTVFPTALPQWIDGLSYLLNGQFYPLSFKTFASLDPGKIYRADKDFKIDIIKPWTVNSLGILSVTKDTLFSIDWNHNPILIKGQMTANFGSPATIYAIKFDRYSTTLFEQKLSLLIRHQLPTDEYFTVQNIHTKFTVMNEPNRIDVAVENGTVKVLNDKIEKTIDAGKQISIDASNKITESIYLSSKIYAIIAGIFVLISSIILFIYRKTKVGGRIIDILKKITILFWKYFKIFIIWLWKLIKKLALILWKVIKTVWQKLVKLAKKMIHHTKFMLLY